MDNIDTKIETALRSLYPTGAAWVAVDCNGSQSDKPFCVIARSKETLPKAFWLMEDGTLREDNSGRILDWLWTERPYTIYQGISLAKVREQQIHTAGYYLTTCREDVSAFEPANPEVERAVECAVQALADATIRRDVEAARVWKASLDELSARLPKKYKPHPANGVLWG